MEGRRVGVERLVVLNLRLEDQALTKDKGNGAMVLATIRQRNQWGVDPGVDSGVGTGAGIVGGEEGAQTATNE